MNNIRTIKDLMKVILTNEEFNNFVKDKTKKEIFEIIENLGHKVPMDWFSTDNDVLVIMRDWYREFRFVPRSPNLLLTKLDKVVNIKLLQKAMKRFSKQYDDANASDMAVKANIALENNNFETYLKLAKKFYGIDDHDAMNLLYCCKDNGALAIKLMKDGKGLYDIRSSLMRESEYSGVEAKDKAFLNECKKWKVCSNDYVDIYEGRWMARSLECDLPNVTVRDGKYTLSLMDKSDPRSLFLGEYTACCQHPNGLGCAAAWYGVEKKNAGFYVIEDKKGNILAQAFAWMNDGGLVLDSIESIRKDEKESMSIVIDMFFEFINKIEKEHYGLQVRVGNDYGTDAINELLIRATEEETFNVPYDLRYSDAHVQLKATKEIEHKEALTLLRWEDYDEIDNIIYKYGLIPHTVKEYFFNEEYNSQRGHHVSVDICKDYTVRATKNKKSWEKISRLIDSKTIPWDEYMCVDCALHERIEEEEEEQSNDLNYYKCSSRKIRERKYADFVHTNINEIPF